MSEKTDSTLKTSQQKCSLHLGVVTGLLVEQVATGPGVAERQLAVSLAGRAATAAPSEEDVHQRRLVNAVLLDGLDADHDVHAAAEEVGYNAHHNVEGVGHALEGLPLARHGAPRAEVGVEALHRVDEALEDTGSPISGHCAEVKSFKVQ